MIKPYGGTLKISDTQTVPDAGFKRVDVDSWAVNDAVMLYEGAFSPLDGFMTEEEVESVCSRCALPDGTVWTIPVIFRTDEKIDSGEEIILCHDGVEFAVMLVDSRFRIKEPEKLCRLIFGTDSREHPGVSLFLDKPDTALSGRVFKIAAPVRKGIDSKYIVSPEQTRNIFRSKNWDTVVGFQTRNPIHRGHEFLHKMSLSFADAVFIHPLIGDTKSDDVPYDVRFRCYEAVTNAYYNPNRYFLSALVANMNYAGPREAVHHAIIRQNFGCSHMIIGRDHAGVGNFYSCYEAQEFYEKYQERLDIKMVKFSEVFYCETCGCHSTEKMCGHTDRFPISGTAIRRALVNGEYPDERMLRKEAASILIEHYINSK